MKLTEPVKVTINETNFYIYPFAAMKAANLSAEVLRTVGPVLSAIVPLIDFKNPDKSVLDYDLSELGDSLATAFSTLDGDKVETLLEKLLLTNHNVAYDNAEGKTVYLDEAALNELFCGETQYIYVLAFYVIRRNYGSFFGKVGSRFGRASETLTNKTT